MTQDLKARIENIYALKRNLDKASKGKLGIMRTYDAIDDAEDALCAEILEMVDIIRSLEAKVESLEGLLGRVEAHIINPICNLDYQAELLHEIALTQEESKNENN